MQDVILGFRDEQVRWLALAGLSLVLLLLIFVHLPLLGALVVV
jgi:hypothetical protein